jgi:hypothetical protein
VILSELLAREFFALSEAKDPLALEAVARPAGINDRGTDTN